MLFKLIFDMIFQYIIKLNMMLFFLTVLTLSSKKIYKDLINVETV